MSVNLNVVINGVAKVVLAKPYPFPVRGNELAGYSLTVTGEPVEIRKTGGGVKYPTYVYLKIDGVSLYLPKNVTPDDKSDVTVVKSAVEALPAVTTVAAAVEAAVTDADAEVKAEKKSRRRVKPEEVAA